MQVNGDGNGDENSACMRVKRVTTTVRIMVSMECVKMQDAEKDTHSRKMRVRRLDARLPVHDVHREVLPAATDPAHHFARRPRVVAPGAGHRRELAVDDLAP